jgi:putative membrane protein
VLGLALLVVLVTRSDLPGMFQAVSLGGWSLLWLVPYRAVYFLLYALGWRSLVRPYDSQRRAGVGYLFWITTVREAIDRLLPVASVGGGVAGVRLLRWRGIGTGQAAATVIVEVFLTLIVLWAFAVIALLLLAQYNSDSHQYRSLQLTALVSLALPVAFGLSLRYGSLFGRLAGVLRNLVGLRSLSEGAASLDEELRACFHRGGTLVFAGSLQLAAMLSGSLENWFALRLFGHPVDLRVAVIMEGLTQAARHAAFLVPGGLGVQEISLVVLGHSLGISTEVALALSLAKRLREVLCGVPSLISWQWLEGRRLRTPMRNPSL